MAARAGAASARVSCAFARDGGVARALHHGRRQRRDAIRNGAIHIEANMTTTSANTYISSEAESREVAQQARQAEWEGKGFLSALFLGTLRHRLIHPFPTTREPRPTFQRFVDELKRCIVDHVDPAAIDETGEYPSDVIDGLRALGSFGMNISDEYGGLGFTVDEYGAAME